MKRNWMTLILAAVGTTSAAVAGEMTAKIPFDFTANGNHMAAGAYSFSRLDAAGAGYFLKVTNQTTRRSVALVSSYPVWKPSAADQSTLTFKCVAGACALSQVQNAWDATAHAFATPSKRGEKERAVAIRLEPASAANGY